MWLPQGTSPPHLEPHCPYCPLVSLYHQLHPHHGTFPHAVPTPTLFSRCFLLIWQVSALATFSRKPSVISLGISKPPALGSDSLGPSFTALIDL